MAIAVASFVQESNDFSPVKTRYENFDLVWGKDALARHRSAFTELGGFLHILSGVNRRIQPLCAGWAVTAGRVRRTDYRRISTEFLTALSRLRRPEALLIALHGGQTAGGAPDVAGDLMRSAREILGPRIPIVVTLDLHANVTRLLVDSVTALVGYKTYPHIDLFETGITAANLLLRILDGHLNPVIAYFKLPLIVPAENMQTTSGPFGRLMRRALELERSGAAEVVSVFGVQPWLDVPEMGCSVVSVTNNEAVTGAHQVEDSPETSGGREPSSM